MHANVAKKIIIINDLFQQFVIKRINIDSAFVGCICLGNNKNKNTLCFRYNAQVMNN